jgi:hypothetical protein
MGRCANGEAVGELGGWSQVPSLVSLDTSLWNSLFLEREVKNLENCEELQIRG